MDFEYKDLLSQSFSIVLIFLPAAVCLALAGLPFMGIFGQILARARQRSFYDKCARQLARLAMWLGFFLVAGSGYEIWPYIQKLDTNAPPLEIGYVICWLLWVASWFFSSLYFSLWNTLKNHSVFHKLLAAVGGTFAFAGIYTVIVIKQALMLLDSGRLDSLTMKEIFIPPMDFGLLIIAVFIPPLVFAMAGGLGAGWLVLRRRQDDFGRDYYNLMTPWCASWARNSWAIVWLLLLVQAALDIWATWSETGGIPADYPFRDFAMFMVLWFIPILLWHIVVGSLTPMRHKIAIFLAPLMIMGFLYIMLQ